MFNIIRNILELDAIKNEIRMLCNCNIEEINDFDMDKLRMIKNLLLQGHKFDKLKTLNYEQLWIIQKLGMMGGI